MLENIFSHDYFSRERGGVLSASIVLEATMTHLLLQEKSIR